MTPIYETDELSDEALEKQVRWNRCAVCHGTLTIFFDMQRHERFLACSDWNRTHHDGGIERPAREPVGLDKLNFETQREIMQERHGNDKAVALRRFEGITVFDKPTATDMLKVLFPNAEKASPAEFAKALGLCVDYGADPRLAEIFMIPFKKPVKDDRGNVIRYEVGYETIRGIRFTRRVANQRHKFTYLDMTPHLMTEAEEITVYRTLDPNKIRAITHVKDLETGKEAWGYGEWSKTLTGRDGKPYKNVPKGTDKGNSMEDMAMKRSEAHGLDRLYAAERYTNVRVADDSAIDAQYRDVTNERTSVEPAALPLDEMDDPGDGDGEPPAAAAAAPAASAVDPPAPPASTASTPPQAPPTGASGPGAPAATPGAQVKPGAQPASAAPAQKTTQELEEELFKADPIREAVSHIHGAIDTLTGRKKWKVADIRDEVRKLNPELKALPEKFKVEDIPEKHLQAVSTRLRDLADAE